MEESMISTNYISKSMCSSYEESRWTSYLEDFMAHYPCGRQDDNALNQSPIDSLLLSGCGTSSFASESPCSGVKKNRFHSHDDGEVHTRRISAKKRKTNIAAFVDRDLEDDACSPDHTPKQANDLSHLFMDYKEMTGSGSIFHEHILSQKLNKQQDEEISNGTYQGKGNIFNENTESYCTELRRKGLCLVPVSILFNRVSN